MAFECKTYKDYTTGHVYIDIEDIKKLIKSNEEATNLLQRSLISGKFTDTRDYIHNKNTILVNQRLANTVINDSGMGKSTRNVSKKRLDRTIREATKNGYDIYLNYPSKDEKETMETPSKESTNVATAFSKALVAQAASAKEPEEQVDGLIQDKIEATQSKPESEKLSLNSNVNIDYSKHLENIDEYSLTLHASERMQERLNSKQTKADLDTVMKDRLRGCGYLVTQETGTQVWGDGSLFFLLDPYSKKVITMLTNGMVLSNLTRSNFDDLRKEVETAIDGLMLKEMRSYWESLSEGLISLSIESEELAEYIAKSYKAKSPKFLETFKDSVEGRLVDYDQSTINIRAIINNHNSRMSFLERFKNVK